jgi:hypothetical protein
MAARSNRGDEERAKGRGKGREKGGTLMLTDFNTD